jgi:CHAT domain-containing protein
LLALSACETGLGKITRGEGIIGLTRAFLYAGVRNLAVSLWKVSDNSTAELMMNFYKEAILNNQTYPFALQKAKIQMLKEQKYASPYYWAAFVLLGR